MSYKQRLKKFFAWIDRYGPDSGGQATFYGSHKIIVLNWPVCFNKALSALDA